MIAPAEQAQAAGTASPIIGFSHVALVTLDLDRFRAFYEDVVGLRAAVVVRTTEPPGLRHAILLVNDASIVHVFEQPGYDPAADGIGTEMFGRGRIDHFGLLLRSVPDLEAVRDRLVAVGASDREVRPFGPVWSVHFTDPDGLEGEINAVRTDWSPSLETGHVVEEEPDPDMFARLVAAAVRGDPTHIDHVDHTRKDHPVQSLKTCLAVTVAALLGLAACGDDDDAATDPTPADAEPADDSDSDDVAAYCEASLAFETVPDPEVDFETASEEEVVTGLKAYATDVLRPAMADIVATAPEELADEADRFSAIVDELAATGDGSLFDSPEAAEISATAHAYDLANCGWESVDVTATNYAFAGIPAELSGGVTSFDLGNEGEDLHELLLVRKNDGVTQSAQELLALPEEEAMSLTTMVGTNAFAAPGEEDFTVVDLEPGDYVALCFVPVGATSTDGPPPEGPPHAMEGMYTEFTVG